MFPFNLFKSSVDKISERGCNPNPSVQQFIRAYQKKADEADRILEKHQSEVREVQKKPN